MSELEIFREIHLKEVFILKYRRIESINSHSRIGFIFL
jgi:hypothetical protein